MWTKYREYLVEQKRAQGTFDLYDRWAALFNTAYGDRILIEVPTDTIEEFLKAVAEGHGMGSARNARSMLSGMFRYAVRKRALPVNPVREAQLVKNVEAKGPTGGAGHIEVDDLRFILTAVHGSVLPCPRTAAHFNVLNICLVTLTVLATFCVLYLAAAIVLPFLIALVLNLLLAPLKRVLTDRLRLPSILSALALVFVLFSAVTVIGFALYLPASGWIDKVPESLPRLQERMSFLKVPIDLLQHQVSDVRHAITQTPKPGEVAPLLEQQQASSAGLGLTILSGTRLALGQIVTVVVTLFFLLTAGDSLLRSAVEILPTFGDKRRAVEIAREIEANISGYLLTITIMNLAVGTAAGLMMWALGVPNPVLWGTLAFLLNYIPILGPMSGVVIFFFVGLFSLPSLSWALAPPALYLLIHVIEGETVTPMLLARRFTLNPVLVIMALFFWDWLWGVPGAVLAVPVMATTKIVCDRVPALTPLGHLLGSSPRAAQKTSMASAGVVN